MPPAQKIQSSPAGQMVTFSVIMSKRSPFLNPRPSCLQKVSVAMLVFLFFGAYSPAAQLTLRVTDWPASSPNARIFLAGNFNGWNPGNPAFELTLQPDPLYSITFTPPIGQLEFKFTRGNWETVETTANGGFRPNRVHTYTGEPKTLDLTIDGWADIDGAEHTTEPNVALVDEAFYMPELQRSRRIWICLPKDYETSGKHYPVLYLQDGQNLFDQVTSFAGEWKIDEAMNALFDQGDSGAIIVGIDNGGSERINEYSPWVHPTYGGGAGEYYARFLAETLKPWIDGHYRTRPERMFTGVGGSSLGGLIALYTAIEHQDIFGKALVLSPSLWFSDSTYLHVADRGVTEDLRIFMAAGTRESTSMIPDMEAMRAILLAEGADAGQVLLRADEDGSHSEAYWSRVYPDGYVWLFAQAVATGEPHVRSIRAAFPNPAHDTVTLDLSRENPERIIVFTPWGTRFDSPSIRQPEISVATWPPGIYILQVWYSGDSLPDIFRIARR